MHPASWKQVQVVLSTQHGFDLIVNLDKSRQEPSQSASFIETFLNAIRTHVFLPVTMLTI